MEKLLQQSSQVGANLTRMQAGWYFRTFSGVSDEQLQRFQNAAARLRGDDTTGAWFDLWLNAEGELVARSFEVRKNDQLGFIGYEENALGDMEPVFSGVAF